MSSVLHCFELSQWVQENRMPRSSGALEQTRKQQFHELTKGKLYHSVFKPNDVLGEHIVSRGDLKDTLSYQKMFLKISSCHL